jgi:PmbA protein
VLGEKKARDLCGHILAASPADQTEAVILAYDGQLTRFANNTIHQNVAELNVEVRVRAVLGRRNGVASTNDLSEGVLDRVVETALEVARFQPENPDFRSLPEPAPITHYDAFDEEIAACAPATRARVAGVICRRALDSGLVASGAFETSTSEVVVANSLGVFTYFPTTAAELSTVIMGEDTSGYASRAAWRIGELDGEALGNEAIARALQGRHPRECPPGVYPVILEPYATQDLLDMMAYLGFSAQAVQEGRSFMNGRFGEQLMSEKVSIWDDGMDPAGLPLPFDFEGVPKRRVDLIVAGVANAVVYDSYTAGKEGKSSTGHALPAPNTFGPYPLNLFMATGEASLAEMIAGMERGLLITRFWYTRPVHPRKVIITGMTRDGTFWLEKGEVAYPVGKLRFTQGYIEALKGVEAVGRESYLLAGEGGGAARVPAISLTAFNFTS